MKRIYCETFTMFCVSKMAKFTEEHHCIKVIELGSMIVIFYEVG